MLLFYERLMRRKMMLGGARSMTVDTSHGAAHVLELSGEGDLPPLVLVHGFSATAATQWGPLVRALRGRFSRILAPDLLGHGHTAVPAGGLSGARMELALRETLDQLLTQPVVMFATSMGGGVALRYVLHRPGAVAGLMVCSPSGAPIPDERLPAFKASFRIQSHADALAFVDRAFPHGHPLRQVYAWGVRQQFNRPHLVEMLASLSADSFLRPEELRRIQVPLTLVWGRMERVLPHEHLGFFREHLPAHARIEEPPDFGHAPFLDRVPEMAARIVAFARALTVEEAAAGGDVGTVGAH